MRLTNEQQKRIVESFSEFLAGRNFSLYLFGSRVFDEKLGGDIDLLLLLDSANLKEVQMIKHRIIYAIKSRIGDEKIDLLVKTREDMNDDAFLQKIARELVLLHQEGK